MKLTWVLLACLLPSLLPAQPTAAENNTPLPEDSLHMLVDSLAAVNELHGPYVGFSGTVTRQYLNFQELVEKAEAPTLLEFTQHQNAVVRGYAFWGLARKQYESLDSVLLAHARDEDLIRVLQGGMVTELPLVDFLQWVVNPELMDGDSKKLDNSVLEKVAELRFSDR